MLWLKQTFRSRILHEEDWSSMYNPELLEKRRWLIRWIRFSYFAALLIVVFVLCAMYRHLSDDIPLTIVFGHPPPPNWSIELIWEGFTFFLSLCMPFYFLYIFKHKLRQIEQEFLNRQ